MRARVAGEKCDATFEPAPAQPPIRVESARAIRPEIDIENGQIISNTDA